MAQIAKIKKQDGTIILPTTRAEAVIMNDLGDTLVETVADINSAIDNIDLSAVNLPITDSGSYFLSDNVEGALQEVGSSLNTKAPIANPTFTGNVNVESSSQYVEAKVKSTHTSGYSMLKLYDGTNTGYDLSYSKSDGNLALNKTLNGSYDSTLLVIHPDYFSYKGSTVWTAGTDGTGSGLDADLLDGQHSSYYATQTALDGKAALSHTHTMSQITDLALTASSVANTPAGTIAATTVQAAINELDTEKSPINSPTFTGTVVLPSTTSIGAVSNTEIGYLDGVTSAIQTQLNGKLSSVPNASTQVSSLGVGTAASGTAGEIRATNNITAYYSDERLKDFHGTIPNALDKVLSLNGYLFTENKIAKDLGYHNGRMQYGVSAQEVNKVAPEVVTDAPIGFGYMSVWYEKLVPLLIEAIKEQQKQIDELKSLVK